MVNQKKQSNKGKGNDWLLGVLVVLVAVTAYNVNAVANGIGEQYLQGLLVVAGASVGVVVLAASFLSKTKTVAR